jgi:hypothetical protein
MLVQVKPVTTTVSYRRHLAGILFAGIAASGQRCGGTRISIVVGHDARIQPRFARGLRGLLAKPDVLCDTDILWTQKKRLKSCTA